jgi:hypothetical protein
MPTPTYTPLATVTLGSTTASVVFGSIPATYRDLVIVASGAKVANGRTGLRFNGDTSTANYVDVFMLGNGTTVSSGTSTAEGYISILNAWGSTSYNFNFLVNVMDYSTTDKHKTTLVRASIPASTVLSWAGRWTNTAAVNSVTLVALGSSSQFTTGTTISLYGII